MIYALDSDWGIQILDIFIELGTEMFCVLDSFELLGR